MKSLNPAPKFLIYAVFRALRYPRTPISYYYCANCKVRFPASSSECPKCHEKVGESPENRKESPIPWYGSVMVIILGITCWVLGASLEIGGLDEAGRALVYIPLGNLFGLSLQKP
ncbi:hypothetical protein ES703_109057 [subsurface metagenome]